MALFISLGVLVSGPTSASAALPIYDGEMFPVIHGPSDPEDYSWEVSLSDEQELVPVDDQHAEVDYTGTEHTAFGITVKPAHDAVGSSVQTSLMVSEGNVISFTVHHRAGNPAAGGAPFVYPIVGGVGWEGGFEMYESQVPPQVPPIKPPLEDAAPAVHASCVVPVLVGNSLRADRRKLRRAGCRLGKIRGEGSGTAKIVKQSPKPGVRLAPGAEVSLTLKD